MFIHNSLNILFMGILLMTKSDDIINNKIFRLIGTHYRGLTGNMKVDRKKEVFSHVIPNVQNTSFFGLS